MLASQDVWRLREAREDDGLRPIPNSRLLREPPEREWMVERCFPKASVAMVSGDGGIGKSLLMQQLLTCAALGLPWLGLSLTQGRGLFFGCEDDEDELHRRLYAICRSIGRPVEDALEGGLELAGRVGRDNILSRFQKVFLNEGKSETPEQRAAQPWGRRDAPYEWKMVATDLMRQIAARCLHVGANYCVIDTATQTFAGNQNDEQQVVQFINQLRRLAIAIQGVVIITKHPSLSGRALGTGESGNTAWNNSVRSRLYVREEGKGEGARTIISGMKANYSRKLDKIPLRWERGCFVLDQPEPAKDYTEAGGYYR